MNHGNQFEYVYNLPGLPNPEIRVVQLHEVNEKYRKVFTDHIEVFNAVQSLVFNDVYYSNKSVAICAPTGSGKTAIMELAVVRWLEQNYGSDAKAIYLAPTKALCTQKQAEWAEKFCRFGVTIMELTGDTDFEDQYSSMRNSNFILTTPEKWDSITRKWKTQFSSVASTVSLVLIDEVHLLSEGERGATLEVVITRMKTMLGRLVRFVAVSATASNIHDVAEWLSCEGSQGIAHKVPASARPIKLSTQVLGYHSSESEEIFKFDMRLNYQLFKLIKQNATGKPCLIFCSTRKGTADAAARIIDEAGNFFLSENGCQSNRVRQFMEDLSNQVQDTKLKIVLSKGVAFHHAGLGIQDRHVVETNFARGRIPVLVSTTTMAVGVNLPAYLVIVKNTFHYTPGKAHQEYSASTINQMIGRAGRPQFHEHGEKTAVALILTKNYLVAKYRDMISGETDLESELHKNLIEHLNAEIFLKTITDIKVAVEWLKSTFLYQRVVKKPKVYDIKFSHSRLPDIDEIVNKIQVWCVEELNQLHHFGLIRMDEFNVTAAPTKLGEIMATYCISFETMKKFVQLSSQTSLSSYIEILSKCKEFTQDISLRHTDKKALFEFNDVKKRSTNPSVIRFANGQRVKTVDEKISILTQVAFGNLKPENYIFQADIQTIVKLGQRLSRCLFEVQLELKKGYVNIRNSLALHKCFQAELWENSPFVLKQLPRVGLVLSKKLAERGFTSFESVENEDPRKIENFADRRAPFGNEVRDNAGLIPKYEVSFIQMASSSPSTQFFKVEIKLLNYCQLALKVKQLFKKYHGVYLVIGGVDDSLHVCQRIKDMDLIQNRGAFSRTVGLPIAMGIKKLRVSLISESLVGVDIHYEYAIEGCHETQALLPVVEEVKVEAPVVMASEATAGKPEPKRRRSNYSRKKESAAPLAKKVQSQGEVVSVSRNAALPSANNVMPIDEGEDSEDAMLFTSAKTKRKRQNKQLNERKKWPAMTVPFTVEVKRPQDVFRANESPLTAQLAPVAENQSAYFTRKEVQTPPVSNFFPVRHDSSFKENYGIPPLPAPPKVDLKRFFDASEPDPEIGAGDDNNGRHEGEKAKRLCDRDLPSKYGDHGDQDEDHFTVWADVDYL
ncbi:putative ATP-dependent DNA helicase HFM1 [Halotydeus destructor]|nr:putative ATP-dependent DNA helicase HFM1 [Halotydeus destructor]